MSSSDHPGPAPEAGASLTAACLQLDGADAPASVRLAAAIAGIERAAGGGADLVVLPELWPVGFFHFDDYEAIAEPPAGPVAIALAEAAARAGCWLYGGSRVERSADGRLQNTGTLFDPTGAARLTYRKVHLFGHASREAEILSPGRGVDVASTPFGPLGATTCFDLRFPEQFRELVALGARVFVVAAAWPAARREHWQVLLRARAIENQAYVIACNAAGSDAGTALAGHSMVIDPWGTVVAEAGERDEILFARFDPTLADAVRERYPFLPGPLAPG